MTRQRVIIVACAAAAVALLAWIFWPPNSPADPVFNGKKISEWVAVWDIEHSSSALKNSFGELTNNHAPEIVAHLIQALQRRDQPFRKARLWLFRHSPRAITGRLNPGPEAHSIREKAVTLLGQLGPLASNAVPALCEIVRTEPVYDTRHAAARTLVFIRPQDTEATATMILVLRKDSSPDIRARAAIFFREVKPESKEVVAALVKALDDPESVVRLHTARALGGYGPEAKDAVEPLIRLIQTQKPDGSDVRAAAAALKAINPEASRAPGIQ